jgi:DNA gyrase inhibitor GyrI
MWHVGIDLGRKSSVVATISDDGPRVGPKEAKRCLTCLTVTVARRGRPAASGALREGTRWVPGGRWFLIVGGALDPRG